MTGHGAPPGHDAPAAQFRDEAFAVGELDERPLGSRSRAETVTEILRRHLRELQRALAELALVSEMSRAEMDARDDRSPAGQPRAETLEELPARLTGLQPVCYRPPEGAIEQYSPAAESDDAGIHDLIDRSSLGTAGGRQLRESVPSAEAASILARARQLEEAALNTESPGTPAARRSRASLKERGLPLPGRLTSAERDFYLELRRLVSAAGRSHRELEEATSSARSGSGETAFFSETQWARWLNADSPPSRRAIRNLAEHLASDGVQAEHLMALWDGTFAPAGSGEAADTGLSPGRLRPEQLPAHESLRTERLPDDLLVEPIAHQPFWELVNPAERDALTAAGWTSVFSRGDALCREGDRTTHVFIVLDGWVRIISVSGDGQRLVLAVRGAGELIGEMAGQTGAPRSATMLASTTVHALLIGHDTFMAFLRAYPSAERVYWRGLVQRWTETAAMMTSLTTRTVAQRLAGLLVDLAADYGTAATDEISITLPLSQEDLAGLIGTTRAPVTRVLRNWRDRGLIRTAHRLITITDVNALLRIAGRRGQVSWLLLRGPLATA
jgi:CRP/FNR family transcriptional regulator, cyclic AMP receptor protein